jgi:hypothetical protein
MRRIVAAAGTFLLAGTTAAMLPAGTASAAATVAPRSPILLGSLHLTATDAAGLSTAADLTCVAGRNVYGRSYIAGTGTVTDPTAACRELAAANGDFTAINVHPTWLASALSAPVSATASGMWRGQAVSWHHVYANGGELTKYTGDVFAF